MSVIGVATMSLAHHIGTAQRHTIAVHAQIDAGVLHRNQPAQWAGDQSPHRSTTYIKHVRGSAEPTVIDQCHGTLIGLGGVTLQKHGLHGTWHKSMLPYFINASVTVKGQ